MMVCEQQEGLKNTEFAEFRREFIPELRCSLICESVRELKMTGEQATGAGRGLG